MISNAAQKMQKGIFFSRIKDGLLLLGYALDSVITTQFVFAFKACDYLDTGVWFGSNFAYIYIVCVQILLDFFHICAVKIVLLYKVLYQAISQNSAN